MFIVNLFQGFAPALLIFTVTLPPANAITCVVLDGADYYRSSCWERFADGLTRTRVPFRDVPAGDYIAALYDDGHLKKTLEIHLESTGL